MDKTKDFLVGSFTFILIISVTNFFTTILDIFIVSHEINKWISLVSQSIIYVAVLIAVHLLLRRNRFNFLMNTKLLVLAAIGFYFLNSYMLSLIFIDYSYMFEHLEINEAKIKTAKLLGIDYAISGSFKIALLILFAYHLLKKQ